MEKKNIYCVYCGKKNKLEEKKCSKCGKKLNPKNHLLKEYISNHLKDDIKGNIEDTIFDLLKAWIKSHLYGIAITTAFVFSTALILTKMIDMNSTKYALASINETDKVFTLIEKCEDKELIEQDKVCEDSYQLENEECIKKDIIKANVNISCPNNFSLVNNICISNYNLEKNKNITCNINDIPQLDTRRIIRERIIGVTEQNGNCYLQYCNDTYTDVVGTLWQPGMQCYDIEYIQNNPIISYTCNGYTDSNGNCKETRNRIISYECEEGTLDGDNCIIITKKEVQLQCRENYQYNSNCKLCEKVK